MMYLGFSPAKTHVTYYNIMRVHPERFACNANSVSRCSLTRNRHIRSTHDNRRFQTNDTGYIEHNDAGTSRFTSFAERSGTTVIQIRHRNHLSATAAETIHTTPFGTWKCRNLCLWQIIGTRSPRYIRATLFGFFFNNRKGFCPSLVRTATRFRYHLIILGLCLFCQLRVLCHHRNGCGQ